HRRRRSAPDQPVGASGLRSATRFAGVWERIAWRLSDNQFAALRLFQRHGAFQRVYGHGGLLVGRRLGGDALQPQAGRRQSSQERPAALGRETDQLVTEARDKRQQQ